MIKSPEQNLAHVRYTTTMAYVHFPEHLVSGLPEKLRVDRNGGLGVNEEAQRVVLFQEATDT